MYVGTNCLRDEWITVSTLPGVFLKSLISYGMVLLFVVCGVVLKREREREREREPVSQSVSQ